MSCCSVSSQYGNTGLMPSELIMKAGQKIFFMPKYNVAGELNAIDVSDPDAVGALLQTLTSATTPMDERLYPFPLMENFTQEKSETVFQTMPSTRKYKVQDGIRSLIFDLADKGSSFRLLAELKKFGCKELVYFIADTCGTLWGGKLVGESFYGIPMSSSSFDVQFVAPTDTTVAMTRVMFDMEYGFNESQIKGITSATLGYSALDLNGIVTVTVLEWNGTSSSLVINLASESNDATKPKTPFTGLVPADFLLAEIEPTPAPVTVATAVESATVPGRYTLTFASQTAGDILEVTAVRGGYEVSPFRFEIPA